MELKFKTDNTEKGIYLRSNRTFMELKYINPSLWLLNCLKF